MSMCVYVCTGNKWVNNRVYFRVTVLVRQLSKTNFTKMFFRENVHYLLI